ncbi:hypothetical protein ACIQI8_27300 [Streptomyces sp. NPDC092369]|uniref:hypothetical protein n=1 Tax=Streptomyces sp. NPDC092369 TaxID=3366015 RepID=UPI00382436DA
MDDKPARPPRPDEEELLRFHNGDTLNSIPVIRLPERQPPPPPRTQPNWWMLGATSVAVAALGALATVGVLQLVFGTDPGRQASAAGTTPQPQNASPVPAQSTSAPASGTSLPVQPSPSPSVSESPQIAAASGPEEVRIIQAPATGGDIATTYCLVYPGSESDGVKDAILLANAPAYQCADLLSYDPVHGSLHETVPVCEPTARATMLVFDPSSGWGDALYFACLTQHHGA